MQPRLGGPAGLLETPPARAQEPIGARAEGGVVTWEGGAGRRPAARAEGRGRSGGMGGAWAGRLAPAGLAAGSLGLQRGWVGAGETFSSSLWPREV